MTCPNQLELGERKKEISETDESTKEGPHSVGVWTLKIEQTEKLGDFLNG